MAKLGGRNCCSRWGMCPGNMVCSDACQCELQQDDRSRMGGTSQPYITGVPSSGVIGPASGIGFSGGYRNASGKMGFASSLGLVGIIGIFGALYLLNRYLEAQPKK